MSNKLTKNKVFIVSSGQYAAQVLELTAAISIQKAETQFFVIIFTGNIERQKPYQK